MTTRLKKTVQTMAVDKYIKKINDYIANDGNLTTTEIEYKLIYFLSYLDALEENQKTERNILKNKLNKIIDQNEKDYIRKRIQELDDNCGQVTPEMLDKLVIQIKADSNFYKPIVYFDFADIKFIRIKPPDFTVENLQKIKSDIISKSDSPVQYIIYTKENDALFTQFIGHLADDKKNEETGKQPKPYKPLDFLEKKSNASKTTRPLSPNEQKEQKRGRQTIPTATQSSRIRQTSPTSPKKRGRPSIPTATQPRSRQTSPTAPKKRGRPSSQSSEIDEMMKALVLT